MFSPPSSLDAAAILHGFGRLQAEQGEACAIRGGVTIEAVAKLNATDLEVTGSVEEGRATPYKVQLYYQPQEDWVLSGDCTCPAGGDCRHCAALAFAWLARKAKSAASEAELQDWLEALKRSQEPAAVPAEPAEQILYRLQAEPGRDDGRLQVIAHWRARGKGQWRKAAPLLPGELAGHNAATAEDREIASLLRALQPGRLGKPPDRQVTVTLQGRLGALVLEQVLATGRAFWNGFENGPGLIEGPLRLARLEWRELPTGQQLHVVLDPPAEALFELGGRVIYADPERGEIGPADLSPQKLQLLRRAPVIAPAAIKRVSRSLLPILPVPLPAGSELSEITIREKLQPVLTLKQDPQDGAHLAILQFDYGGRLLPPDPAYVAESVLMEGESVCRIVRDAEGEKAALARMLLSGLLPLEGTPGGYGFAGDGLPADQFGPYLRSWHHWLGDTLPELRALNWRIELDPSFRLAFVTSPAWQAELKETAKDAPGKWFDLGLGMEIDGEKVDLLPMLLRLLRTVPDPRAMREQLEQHDTWLLPLDPHPLKVWAARSKHESLAQRWLEVPARRLANLLDILIELYDWLPGSAEPDHLSLSAFSALQIGSRALIHPNDYGVQWQAPAGLKEAVHDLAGRPQDGSEQVPPPPGLKAELRPYQQRGLNWLQTLRRLGLDGILADDMGLGKTLQTLAHLLIEKQAGRLNMPALIVMPTSVLGNWERETARFAPELRFLSLYGSERTFDESQIRRYDLVFTTYALLRRDAHLHRGLRYSWLILDEAQTIKNPRSETARTACAQPAERRLCLSGTPLENTLEELWSLFHFLMPGFLDTLERFNSRFRYPIERQGDTRRQLALRERIRPLMLRRRKLEVEKELPPRIEILRTVSFGSAQADLYEAVRLAVDAQVTKIIGEKGFKRSRIVILDALLKLRQVCCHPHLLDLPQAQKVRRSAKLELLMELVPELAAEGRRMLIFSQFVKMLELIAPRLEEAGLPYEMLTGRTRRRQEVIDRFQRGSAPVFLISLKAGGVGLNLTAADTVIHYDPWWNPAAENQATDRAWRIGQEKPVFVYKLIAEQTVEEKILQLQQAKDSLRESLFEDDPAATLQTDALLSLLKGQGL